MADKEKPKTKAGKYVPWYVAGAAVIIAVGALLFSSLQPFTEKGAGGAVSVCGNDIIEAGEDCDGAMDDGTKKNQACTTIAGGFTGGVLRCSSACAFDTSGCTVAVTTPSAGVCGNGVLTAGEECDDSNAISGDGCSATCTEEVSSSVCGSSAAVCEFGSAVACTTSAGYGGVRNCKSDCSGYRSCTTTRYCGDNILNGPEQCDDGDTVSGDGCSATCTEEVSSSVCGTAAAACEFGTGRTCTTSDGYIGVRNCQSDCRGYRSCSTTRYCGDNILNGLEECDDGNSINSDGCSNSCRRLETCTPTAEKCDSVDNDCDGVVDEGCDDDNDNYCDSGMGISGTPTTCTAGGNDCADAVFNINPGAPEQCDGLDNDCDGTVDEGCAAAVCGDGVIQAPNSDGVREQCDDGNTISGDGCWSNCNVQAGYSCSGQPSVCTAAPTISVSYLVDGIVRSDVEPGDIITISWISESAPAGSSVLVQVLNRIGRDVLLEESSLGTTGSTTITIPASYAECVSFLGGRENLDTSFRAILLASDGALLGSDETSTADIWCT